jgi:transketolase
MTKEELMNVSEYTARNMRKSILEMACRSGAAHTACSLSAADIIAVLFTSFIRLSPELVQSDHRDRFIMSKGHAAMVVYAGLKEAGLLTAADLEKYCTDGSPLAGHVSHHVAGIDVSTGALGHGLPIGCGLALSFKHDALTHRVYVVMGDGESNEGSVWEAAQFAAGHKLDNLVAVIDCNKFQGYGPTAEILEQGNLGERFSAFGWQVARVNGHNHAALQDAFAAYPAGKPLAVIADTIKGKGFSLMEGDNVWHYRPPNQNQLQQALKELSDA